MKINENKTRGSKTSKAVPKRYNIKKQKDF